MIPYLTEDFGNPASRSHAFGWKAEEAVEKARAQVAALVAADAKEIVWTSGATESNNLAIKGAAQFYRTKGKHLITVRPSTRRCSTPARAGAPGLRGDLPGRRAQTACSISTQLEAAIRPDTILVSVMSVNNEIGVIQDIAAIGEIVPEARRAVPRRCGAGDRQDADRPEDAEGRPDVVFGAQDLRPQGHRRAVRAAQAARAPRSADARRRPRARHALRHAGDAPDRRHGRGVPHRAS